ncbi:MAG TPA: hypothetical protein VN661_09770 [Candidatus Acidoferrales bacterium]|nr:hypothetical protein [Candidatus Acidoferrales bacterium]
MKLWQSVVGLVGGLAFLFLGAQQVRTSAIGAQAAHLQASHSSAVTLFADGTTPPDPPFPPPPPTPPGA